MREDIDLAKTGKVTPVACEQASVNRPVISFPLYLAEN